MSGAYFEIEAMKERLRYLDDQIMSSLHCVGDDSFNKLRGEYNTLRIRLHDLGVEG